MHQPGHRAGVNDSVLERIGGFRVGDGAKEGSLCTQRAALGGANTRRIRKALEPLLGSKHLSKSAVSRIVGRLKRLYAEWQERDLSGERYAILFLDAI